MEMKKRLLKILYGVPLKCYRCGNELQEEPFKIYLPVSGIGINYCRNCFRLIMEECHGNDPKCGPDQ